MRFGWLAEKSRQDYSRRDCQACERSRSAPTAGPHAVDMAARTLPESLGYSGKIASDREPDDPPPAAR